MTQLGFYFDQTVCTGCKACTVSCKDKNDCKVGVNYRRVYEFENGSSTEKNGVISENIQAYFLSMSCNHCTDPKCVKNCPTGAMHKRKEDGVVIIDHKKCVGCKYCVWACPYGAPQYNEELGMMTKCDTCVDLREQGEEPVCVNTCPMSAIEFGDIEELRKKHGNCNEVKGMPSASITNPNIVINPHRFAK